MSTRVQHHYVRWIDRNARDSFHHVHPWQAECSCGGWIGIPRRTKKRAREDFEIHAKDRRTARVRQTHADRFEKPRPTTPRDQLPPELL